MGKSLMAQVADPEGITLIPVDPSNLRRIAASKAVDLGAMAIPAIGRMAVLVAESSI
jgi:hypothetical protein